VSDERSPASPLRDALARMRAELDSLIGREIEHLLAAGAEGRGPGAGTPARARLDDGGERAGDPGSRLDALARRLDGRLRQPRARTVEPKPQALAGAHPNDRDPGSPGGG
jgi:hypothetical protein